MTRDWLLQTLRGLENGGADSDGRQCCSWCGESPPNAPCHQDDAEDIEHLPDCKLAKAIAWLEDEKNRRGLVSADFEHGLLTISGHFESGWVLR